MHIHFINGIQFNIFNSLIAIHPQVFTFIQKVS